MQPFLTKTLLSMLAGSFHLACKVTLTSRREAILPSPLYILPNTTQRYYFVISLKFPSQRGAFVWCGGMQSVVLCRRDIRRDGLGPTEPQHIAQTQPHAKGKPLPAFYDKRTRRSPKKDEKSSLQRSGNMLYYHCDTTT